MATILYKHFDINKNLINLEPSKQPPYRPIYSLKLVELKNFKSYIKTNLINSFIKSLKFNLGISIFFSRILDKNIGLYINY